MKSNIYCMLCGGKLLGGPKGGLSQNVLCVDCNEEFTFWFNGITRLGKADNDRINYYKKANEGSDDVEKGD